MSKSTVRCMHCGVTILSDAESYAQHVKQAHSLGTARVVPMRTSGRTKGEIVRAVEDTMRDFIITPEEKTVPEPEHSTECRCIVCFNRQLDRCIDGKGIAWGEAPGHEQISVDAEN